jgi:DNA polymerase-3 subunit epsilon
MAIANRYAGKCEFCEGHVPAGIGRRINRGGRWVNAHTGCVPAPAPPPFGEHDGWHRQPLAAVDVETTGVDPATDRVVSAAVVRSDGTRRSWLVDPGVPVPAEATAVHGFTGEYLATHGRPAAACLPEIAGELTTLADAGVPLVAYRAGFDLTMLHHELVRYGLAPLPVTRMVVIDPYVLDRQADRYRPGRRTLAEVCVFYRVPLVDAHSAVGDADAALRLAVALGACYPQLAAMAPADLHRAQVGWHKADATRLQDRLRSRGSDEWVVTGWPLAV